MSQPKARKGATELTPEAFLATYPAAVAALAETLRQLVKASVPNVAEAVYPGWKLIGYRLLDRPGGRYFYFIAPLADEVMAPLQRWLARALDASAQNSLQ